MTAENLDDVLRQQDALAIAGKIPEALALGGRIKELELTEQGAAGRARAAIEAAALAERVRGYKARKRDFKKGQDEITATREAFNQVADTAKAFIAAQVLSSKKLAALSPILSTALLHAPDGDMQGHGVGVAIRECLIFHRLATGLRADEEPNIRAVAGTLLDDLSAQLDAAERGLAFPQ
jgi:hypothetical protein